MRRFRWLLFALSFIALLTFWIAQETEEKTHISKVDYQLNIFEKFKYQTLNYFDSLKSERVYPCLDNSTSICDEDNQLNTKAIKYFERQWSEKDLLHNIETGLGKDSNKYHWSISASLRAYIEMFEITRKKKYLDFVADASLKILAKRDDRLKLKDELRKKTLLGWGSRLSSFSYKRVVSLDQSMALLYPMAMFVRIVGTNPRLKMEYNEELKILTQDIVASLKSFDKDWDDNLGYYRVPHQAKNLTCKKYYKKKKISKSLRKNCYRVALRAKRKEPLPNHVQSIASLVLLELNSYLQFEFYMERLAKVSYFLKRNFYTAKFEGEDLTTWSHQMTSVSRKSNNRVHARWVVELIMKYQSLKPLIEKIHNNDLFSEKHLVSATNTFNGLFPQRNSRGIASVGGNIKAKGSLSATDGWLLMARKNKNVCDSVSKIMNNQNQVNSLNFVRLIGQCSDFKMNYKWLK